MKIAGVVGGTGPESTVDYYRLFVRLHCKQTKDGSYPELVFYCIDNKKLLDLVAADALEAVAEYLLDAVERLARVGADFALFAANTPHIAFNLVRPRSPLPLLSIVEATCEEAKALGLERLGLFGTRFTMQGRFYPAVFDGEGIDLVRPTPEEQAFIHEKYVGELIHGSFLPKTRDGFLEIVDRLRREAGIDGLILGGTELPLLLRDVGNLGIPLLDTATIHVQRAVAEMLAVPTIPGS